MLFFSNPTIEVSFKHNADWEDVNRLKNLALFDIFIPNPEFVIILGNFYSLESANLLKKRIKAESYHLSSKKISILKKNKHNFEVFLGPYKTIKMIKNDYIALKQINFDEVDVQIYE